MLTTNKRGTDTYRLLRLMLSFRLLKDLSFRGERLKEKGVLFLIAVMVECSRTNEFAKLEVILRLLGMSRVTADPDRLISPLLRLGLIERPSFGMFVLTIEAEFFLRDIETMLSRVTNKSPRSKWRNIEVGDIRAKYVRKAQKKGAKIVAVPVDDRHKLRHGLPVLKKNGKPRNINLPGSPSI